MPAPVATICHSTGSHHVTPRTNSAPSSAPGTEPSPPITTMVNTTRLSPALYESIWSPFCWCTNSAPANAARNPEIAKASRVVVRGFTPNALAARSFSRIATNARPVRLRRIPTTATITSASATRQRR